MDRQKTELQRHYMLLCIKSVDYKNMPRMPEIVTCFLWMMRFRSLSALSSCKLMSESFSLI